MKSLNFISYIFLTLLSINNVLTATIKPSLSACPHTKTQPVICNRGGEYKESKVITLTNSSKGLCTITSYYCGTYKRTTTTTSPIIKRTTKPISACTHTTIKHAVCHQGESEAHNVITLKDSSKKLCTITSYYCLTNKRRSTTSPKPSRSTSIRDCITHFKTKLPTCKSDETRTSIVYTYTSTNSSNDICTHKAYYCTKEGKKDTTTTTTTTTSTYTTSPIIKRTRTTTSTKPIPACTHTKGKHTHCHLGESEAAHTITLEDPSKHLCTVKSYYCLSYKSDIVTYKATVTKTKRGEPSNQSIDDDQHCGSKFAQCGGKGFKGATCCKSGLSCHQISEYYHQCY